MEIFSNDFGLIIAEDFNVDVSSDTNYCEDLINMLVKMSFASLITEPTRCTNTSSTSIDHIRSNTERNFHFFCF